MTVPQELTNDDLLWLIGQKEATLLLLVRQMKRLLAENEQMKAEKESQRAADNGEAPHETVPAQTTP